MTSSAKVWYLIEVAEVEIAVLRGGRSGQGPGKKKFDQKNSEIWATQMLYTPKESWEQFFLRLEVKYLIFYWKMSEKNIFMIFDDKNPPKNFLDRKFL